MVNFIDAGRQSREVETDATQPCVTIGVRGGPQAFLFETAQDEIVTAGKRPGRISDGGPRRIGNRLKGPMILSIARARRIDMCGRTTGEPKPAKKRARKPAKKAAKKK